MSKAYDLSIKGLGACLLAAIVGLLLLQVFGRYVVHTSLPWTEELARFGLVWLTMVGAWMAEREYAHFGIDVFSERLGRLGVIVAKSITILALTVLVYGAYEFLPMLHGTGSPILGLPMSWVYAPVAVVPAVMIIELLVALVRAEQPKSGKLIEGI